MSESVPTWMRGDGLALSTAATGLGNLATALGEEETTLSSTLRDAAGAMGWEGSIEERSRATAEGASPMILRLADAVQAASTAVAELAAALQEYGPQVVRVEGELAALRATPPTREVNGRGQTYEVTDHQALQSAENDLLSQLDAVTMPLNEADSACQSALAAVEQDVTGLMPPGTTPQWTRSMVPGGAWGVLSQHGVVDTPEEEELLRAVTAQPAETVRELLSELTPERLEAFLARHPQVMAILARDYDPVAGGDEIYTGLIEATGADSLSIPVDPAAVVDVAEYWESLSESEQHRLRLLYPYVVGNLDGVDLESRALANRSLVRDALEAERLWEAALEAGPSTADLQAEALEQARENWWWNPVSEWSFNRTFDFLTGDNASLVKDTAHPDLELERSRGRMALYESLLYEAPVVPHGGTTLPEDQRALLVFDPRGDGRFAEWNGSFDAPNVGVFVPGTTTNMSTIDSYNRRMISAVQLNPGDTAMVTWMGTDLPDAVLSDATQTSYSTTGGRALTSFVEGLGLGELQELTLVGHSAGGGIVGAADTMGVDADRILHIASAGTGAEVSDADQYPDVNVRGEPRSVDRFSMTAPGDSIEIAQQSGDLKDDWRVGWAIPDDWGHGFDPDQTPGFTRLETGRFTEGPRAGERLEGLDAHGHVVQPGTDAFNNLVGVVRGTEAIPYREEQVWRWSWWKLGYERADVNVYDDQDYEGTPPMDLQWMTPVGAEGANEPMIMAPGENWFHEDSVEMYES